MKKLDDAKRRFGVTAEVFKAVQEGDIDINTARRSRLESFLTHEARLNVGLPPIIEENATNFPGAARPFIEVADTGNVKQLQTRNLRLKMEINRLNEMLNDRDELIDKYRNPKPLKWVAAAVLVGLVFVAHHYGFM